jgi:hypothetical protein
MKDTLPVQVAYPRCPDCGFVLYIQDGERICCQCDVWELTLGWFDDDEPESEDDL